MIVYETGMIQGAIGGGCAEANLMQHAREVIRDGGYQIRHVDMTGRVAEEEGSGLRRRDAGADPNRAEREILIRNEKMKKSQKLSKKQIRGLHFPEKQITIE
ncbi:MAG: XdhC family protein [Lachnospiraceae bacterium]